ncbi:MAG: BatD family protein [Motiliproteus sp.]
MVMIKASNMNLLTALLLLWTALGSNLSHAATFTASIDRSTVSIDETLTLTLRIDSRSATGQPDLTALTEKFQILNRSKSTQVRAINGNAEASTEWNLQLEPLVSGEIIIPSFSFNGARSQPLLLTVTAAQPSSRPSEEEPLASEEVTLQLTVNSHDVYVGQQILVSLQLQTAVGLTNLELERLSLENADLIPLGEQQFQKVQNGRRYQIYQLNYAIIPRQAGSLILPSLQMAALKDQPRSQYGGRRGQPLQRKTEPQIINVKTQPTGYGNNWLPASSLSLKQTLSQPDDGYRVGTPISRQLQIDAQGLQANRLPELKFASQSGVKHYPEPAKLDQKKSAVGLFASQVESYVLVPTRAGTITLPAIEIRWWDTVNDRPQIARIAEQTIEILAADNGIDSAQGSATDSSASPPPIPVATDANAIAEPDRSDASANKLLLTNIAWALLCALLAALWLRARARTPRAPQNQPKPATRDADQTTTDNERQAYQQLETACRQGDWQRIRNALTGWYQYAEPSMLDNAPLAEQTRRLDLALYGDQKRSDFDGGQLLQVVGECRQQQPTTSREPTVLPPLYR